MSQHGYTYGAPEGFYQPQTAAHIPYPPYGATAYPPSGTHTSAPFPHQPPSQQSFDSNGSVIPGLGLGFPGTTAPPAPWGPSWNSAPAAQHAAQGAQPPEANDDAEEGEVNEDEMEDIYEPKNDAAQVVGAQESQDSQETAGTSGIESPGLSSCIQRGAFPN